MVVLPSVLGLDRGLVQPVRGVEGHIEAGVAHRSRPTPRFFAARNHGLFGPSVERMNTAPSTTTAQMSDRAYRVSRGGRTRAPPRSGDRGKLGSGRSSGIVLAGIALRVCTAQRLVRCGGW